MARVTNLINKAEALKQLNASLKTNKAEYDKNLKEYETRKAQYDKDLVAFNKAVVAASITHLKSIDLKDNVFRGYYNGVNVDFKVRVDLKEPNQSELCKPSKTLIQRIERQIRSVSIMAGETFNASMLDDDFFNCI